jgi:phosphatidylglycerophosphate synthase
MATLQYKEAGLHTQLAATATIDEWWDAHVNRPLAALLVRSLAGTAVTANQITVLSGFTGVLAGVCIAMGRGYWPLLGGFLLFTTMVLDCADGQLARLRGGGSFIGRMMDGFVDWITAMAVHIGVWGYFAVMGFNFFGREVHGPFTAFLVALAVGVSMGVHSMIYDSYKNRLKRLTGEGVAETHSPHEVEQRIARAHSWGERFYLRLYWVYCKSQASVSGEPRGPERLDPALARLRHHYLGRGLRLWSPLGPTTRLTVLAFSAVLATYVWWGLYVYVVFAFLAANLYALVVSRLVRRLEEQLAAEEAHLSSPAT